MLKGRPWRDYNQARMRVVPPGSPLIDAYKAAATGLNNTFGHAFPPGADGDANGLIGRCPACGETLLVRPVRGEGAGPVVVGPHGPCVRTAKN
jgi:hypothetical protein